MMLSDLARDTIMRILVMCFVLLVVPLVASAQPWGSAPFDVGYEVLRGADGDPATMWLGQCQPQNPPGTCGPRPLTPPTPAGWHYGRDLGSLMAISGLTVTFPAPAYRPTTVSVRGCTDAISTTDGAALTQCVTLGLLPSGLTVSVALSGSYRHIGLVMSTAPGEPGCGFASCEYMPGVAELVVETTGTPSPSPSLPSEPADIGPWCEGCATVTITGASVAHAMGCYGTGGPETFYGGQCGDQAWAPWWGLLNLFRPRVVFINRAIPGVGTNLTAPGLNSPPWSSQIGAAIADGGGILVEIGTNDCAVGRSASDAAAAIAAGLDQILAAGRAVALLETMPRAAHGNAAHAACFTALRQAVRQLARERPGVRWCPTHETLRDPGSTDPNAPARVDAPDGTHFTQRGQILLGTVIVPRCLDWQHRMPGS